MKSAIALIAALIFSSGCGGGKERRQESLYSDYWRKRYLRARRIID